MKKQFSSRPTAINSRSAQEGQALVEYSLILLLVAVVVIVIIGILGSQIGSVFSSVTSGLSAGGESGSITSGSGSTPTTTTASATTTTSSGGSGNSGGGGGSGTPAVTTPAGTTTPPTTTTPTTPAVTTTPPTTTAPTTPAGTTTPPTTTAPTTPAGAPAKVNNLQGSKQSFKVVLTWSSVAGATSYTIYRRQGTSGQWSPLTTVSPAAGSSQHYTDSSVRSNKTYQYYVVASNQHGNSPASNITTVNT